MTTRTRIARIAATIAVLLAAPAYAQQPQGITKDPLKQPAGSFVLKMGNEQGALQGFAATWTGGKVATDQWDAPDAKMPAKAEGAMFEFIASTGAPRMFYNWVSAAFSGKNVPQAGEVIRKSVMGVAHTEQFAAAVVGEVDFRRSRRGNRRGRRSLWSGPRANGSPERERRLRRRSRRCRRRRSRPRSRDIG